MSHFMESLKGRGVYFLDSLTSSHSLAYRLASQKESPLLPGCIFRWRTFSFLRYYQLQKTVEIAKKNGQAIAIGHPNEVTYEAIYQFVSNFSEPGVEIVFFGNGGKKLNFIDDDNCLFCGSQNPYGFHLVFRQEDDFTVTETSVPWYYQGFKG